MPDTNYTYSTLTAGSKKTASAGTAVALASTATPCRRVVIKAFQENTDVVAVGDSTVKAALASRVGITLNPGEAVELPIDDVSKIYLDSVVSTEGVGYVYFKN